MYASALITMAVNVVVMRAVQSPGLGIASMPVVIKLVFSIDSFVCHSYTDPFPTPVCLPVASPKQILSTQHLFWVVKSFRMVRIWLLLPHPCQLSVPFRQQEQSVCCVRLQCELTVIWLKMWNWFRKKPTIQRTSISFPLNPALNVNSNMYRFPQEKKNIVKYVSFLIFNQIGSQFVLLFCWLHSHIVHIEVEPALFSNVYSVQKIDNYLLAHATGRGNILCYKNWIHSPNHIHFYLSFSSLQHGSSSKAENRFTPESPG